MKAGAQDHPTADRATKVQRHKCVPPPTWTALSRVLTIPYTSNSQEAPTWATVFPVETTPLLRGTAVAGPRENGIASGLPTRPSSSFQEAFPEEMSYLTTRGLGSNIFSACVGTKLGTGVRGTGEWTRSGAETNVSAAQHGPGGRRQPRALEPEEGATPAGKEAVRARFKAHGSKTEASWHEAHALGSPTACTGGRTKLPYLEQPGRTSSRYSFAALLPAQRDDVSRQTGEQRCASPAPGHKIG